MKGTYGAFYIVSARGWDHGTAGGAEAGQVRRLRCWVFVLELLTDGAGVVERGWFDKRFASVGVATLLAEAEATLLLQRLCLFIGDVLVAWRGVAWDALPELRAFTC